MNRLARFIGWQVCSVALVVTGCMPTRPIYFGDDGDLSHYEGVATQLDEPDIETDRIGDVEYADEPLTLRNAAEREIWEVSLQEAVQTALANSKVVRTIGGIGGFPIQSGQRAGAVQTGLTRSGSEGVQTTYAPSIIETDPRFGTEATLAAFDAQLATSIFWQKNDRPQNFFIDGLQQSVFQQDIAQQTLELSKRTGSGGQVFVRNHNNYELNNNQSNLFSGAYTADIETEFRHPLLQGAGVQFNQIAGPNSIPGFYNGVVIARLTHDVALADLEANVRNIVSDVEQSYWRLSFLYRDLESKKKGRDAALVVWRSIRPDDPLYAEPRSREQYFFFRTQMEDALSELFTAENNLRYLMGIASTDGRLIRPSDEPTTARVSFDWYSVHQEMLARQIELRQQKYRVKAEEMRLIAAKNFLLPRLDLVGLYRWRGFGENLLDGQRENTIARPGPNRGPNPISRYNSAYQTLTQGDYQEWQMGAQFSMPIGFRREMAGVRNQELNLARDRAVLQEMELEFSHQLSEAIRNLDREYAAMQTNLNRLIASNAEIEVLETRIAGGLDASQEGRNFDLLFQAQRRQVEAETAFYSAVGRYNVAIAGVHYRKGSLLEYNGVTLAEGPWADKAYFDAYRRAQERDAGWMIDYGFSRPNPYIRGPVDQNGSSNFLPALGEPTLEPNSSTPGELPNEEAIPAPAAEPVRSATRDARTLDIAEPTELPRPVAPRAPLMNHEDIASPAPAGTDRTTAKRPRVQHPAALDRAAR